MGEVAVVTLFVLVGLAIIVLLGFLPGRIAERNGHPHVEAIKILSWLGLFFTGGLLWIVALAWAYVGPKAETNNRNG